MYKSAETFANPRYKEHPMNWVPGWPKISGSEPVTLQIPEERIALVFVFTVFDGVSYGMVMNSGVDNVRAGYPVRNPDARAGDAKAPHGAFVVFKLPVVFIRHDVHPLLAEN